MNDSSAVSTEAKTQAAPPGPPPASGAAGASPAPRRRFRPGALGLKIVVAVALLTVAVYVYVPGLYEERTDDAYVEAHVVSVMPKVAAYVQALHVDDNAQVSARELLVELDPRDYRNAVNSAAADLQTAEANAANASAQLAEQNTIIAQAAATILSDQAALIFAGQELSRYTSLVHESGATLQQLQQTQANIVQRRADMQHDQAALDQAKAHVAVLNTELAQARAIIAYRQAALAQARLNLSYTRIEADGAGSIANKTVEVGNFVQPGQTLFSIVPETRYIIANYKETQITRMRPGQPVSIAVDGFPSLRLNGHVDSLQQGTGSIFELLPPENATGNFVKVVQRLPVKIVFDDPLQLPRYISPGMSVETEVYVKAPPWWLSWFH